ncbi:MAG: hypothetical protein MK105_15610, partial [Crocinitomicaceae bacterium]|nr:hypothetical protein [Crocinitomicaceae bacterium]
VRPTRSVNTAGVYIDVVGRLHAAQHKRGAGRWCITAKQRRSGRFLFWITRDEFTEKNSKLRV